MEHSTKFKYSVTLNSQKHRVSKHSNVNDYIKITVPGKHLANFYNWQQNDVEKSEEQCKPNTK